MLFEDFLKKYCFVEFTDNHYKNLSEYIEDDTCDNLCNFLYIKTGVFCGSVCPFSKGNNIFNKWCGENESMDLAMTYDNDGLIRKRIKQILEDYESTIGFWNI